MHRISNKNFLFILLGLIVISSSLVLIAKKYYHDDVFDYKNITNTISRELDKATKDPNSLSVTDFHPTNSLVISTVSLTQAGYAVVFSQSVIPDNIIGNSGLLSADEHQNLQIQLEQEIEAGEVVIIVLFHDDGDEIFAIDTDTLVQDNEGNAVIFEFVVEGEDQAVEINN